MVYRCHGVTILGLFIVVMSFSQTSPQTGLRDNTPGVYAIVNARIIVSPGKVIPKGTMIIRNGTIEAVGERTNIPSDARTLDFAGQTLYPGLIDLSCDIGVAKPVQATGGNPFELSAAPSASPTLKGTAHWNSRVKADYDAGSEFTPDAKYAEKLRSQGLTTVLATPQVGIFRGMSALVNLGDDPANTEVLKKRVTQTISLESSFGFSGGYPSSLMGTIALIRQTWLDAEWYRKAQESFVKNPSQKRPEQNASLAALGEAAQEKIPVVIIVSDDVNFLRAAKIAKEFPLNVWIQGGGYEYRRLEAIKATKLPIIVPVNFPEIPTVDSPEEAMNYSLEELRHWDAAPENPGRLEKAGITFALTSATLKDQASFLSQVRRAIERGLSPDAALDALTTTPARWLGVENHMGTLEKGKAANFVVTDGDLFSEKTKISAVWIDGKQYDVKTPLPAEPRGVWEMRTSMKPDAPIILTLRGDAEKPGGSIKWDSTNLRISSASFSGGRLVVSFNGDSIGMKGTVRLSGTVGANDLFGIGEFPNGQSFTWSAVRKESPRTEQDSLRPKKTVMASFGETFPSGEYGRSAIPDQPANILVKNATIWTEAKEGKLEHADMLISKGKIVQIGNNLGPPANTFIVDATGKHVSPGIIDAHSHTAISGNVNEGTHAISAEVRIQDVLDPNNIWIYRQLAGGTTVANVLHGSANPIGGQNAIVKWRWGMSADEMLLEGAPPGIKFALGENVKQSNFTPGGRPSTRYPLTRQGVEQTIKDEFEAALDYERDVKEWEKDKTKIPPRRDLALDAVLEIINGKRQIHCHAYRSDEMMMLMHLMDGFGVKIAAFQHVLEGYKIADEMAKRGIAGSSFSDWWAYKMEAWDAIPGNGPIMHDQGVVVSYNSDSDELARRLNWEAAKAVKFGLSEEEALKFVTINSAMTLGIQNRVGSLEPGKDADFVVWSGDPLSYDTKCEQTWIDGRRFFGIQEDQELRNETQKERAVLIQKILSSKRETPALVGMPFRMLRPNEEIDNSCTSGQDFDGGSHEN